jgi:hypothetical protein
MPAQAYTNINYELQSLGWKAFQDLCATIISEILGQTVQTFLPTKDAGRDGAFCGSWSPAKGEKLKGSFTVQCKFSVKRDSVLQISHIKDELEKARSLASRGLARNYLLLTNHTVTGSLEIEIRSKILSIDGIEEFRLFGNDWITTKIKENARLRMLVPRIYGLGDLSQILDERAHTQARYILDSMADDLSKFVITGPHRKSAKALVEHGFVLLLGEPASGKSTIAASLALGAIDIWGCSTLKVRDAYEFKKHWNPNEPKQFFWIDDAFGPTQYLRSSVDNWNACFPHLHAAIRAGARILFTSRDYVFKSALNDLKLSAFPLISNSQVSINVHKLTQDEREQMLYNHLKLGNQPRSFKTAIRPHLAGVAVNERFLPEIARRLGDKLFTKELIISATTVKRFVEEPRSFLKDTLQSLDLESKAAIALIFMNGGLLHSPLALSKTERQALRLMGGTLSGVRQALSALNGSIVKFVRTEDQTVWTYKHPTVADAFSSIVAEDPELLNIYVQGTPVETLINEVVCGEAKVVGAKVVIGRGLYDQLAKRLLSLNNLGRIYYFLAVRSGKSFLEFFTNRHPEIYDRLQSQNVIYQYQDELLIKLFEVGLLPEKNRKLFIQRLADAAVETPEADFLTKRIRRLFKKPELERVIERIRTDLLPFLDDTIQEWKMNHYGSDDLQDHYAPLLETLEKLGDEFGDDAQALEQLGDAIDRIHTIINDSADDSDEESDESYIYDDRDSVVESERETRDIFDDVDK